jgi:hypothetical protein
MTCWDFDWIHIIGIAATRIDGVILCAIGQHLADYGQVARQSTIIAAGEGAGKVIFIARIVGVYR